MLNVRDGNGIRRESNTNNGWKINEKIFSSDFKWSIAERERVCACVFYLDELDEIAYQFRFF